MVEHIRSISRWRGAKISILFLLLVPLIIIDVACAGTLRERLRDRVHGKGTGSDAARSTEAIRVNGRERTFILHVPSRYNTSEPVPVLFAFHGGRGTGPKMATMTGFNELADAQGFLAVYPNGQTQWNDGRGTTDAEKAGIDDVAFVRAMIEHLGNKFRINRQRIYAAGISNGGIFTNRLGCEFSEQLAAIAFVVGEMATPMAARCELRKPISVLGIFGTDDPLMPWKGGQVQGGERGPVLGAEATMDLWVRKNACQTPGTAAVEPPRVNDGTLVKKTTYSRCKEGREVVFITIEGGGHAWPPAGPASTRITGRSSRNLNASQVVWGFFSEQPPR